MQRQKREIEKIITNEKLDCLFSQLFIVHAQLTDRIYKQYLAYLIK